MRAALGWVPSSSDTTASQPLGRVRQRKSRKVAGAAAAARHSPAARLGVSRPWARGRPSRTRLHRDVTALGAAASLALHALGVPSATSSAAVPHQLETRAGVAFVSSTWVASAGGTTTAPCPGARGVAQLVLVPRCCLRLRQPNPSVPTPTAKGPAANLDGAVRLHGAVDVGSRTAWHQTAGATAGRRSGRSICATNPRHHGELGIGSSSHTHPLRAAWER